MKCNNTFSFSNLHIQDGIVFAARVAVAALLCVLWNILPSDVESAIGYIKLFRVLFVLWMIYSIYEYSLSWIFPQVRSIDLDQDHIIINGKDKFTYTKDSYLSVRYMRFTAIDLNRYIRVIDEEEGKDKIYWFGNIFWSKNKDKRKEAVEKISGFENKLMEKFAYAYLCDNSTEDNTFVNIDIKRLSREHLIDTLLLYVPAFSSSFAGLMTLMTGPVSAFWFICSFILFGFGILNTLSYRRDIKVFVNSAEITRKCIRIDNDLFNIKKELDVSYVMDTKEKKELRFSEHGTYLKMSDGINSKRFWLGPDYLYRKEQILLKYVLDSIVKYVKFYGEV